MHALGRIIAVLGLSALVVVLVGGLCTYLVVRHDVDRASLSYSVASRIDGFVSCRHRQGRAWRCVASPEQAPNVGPWDVSVAGHCWRARLDRSVSWAKGRAAFHGCVSIWDQVRFRDHGGSFSIRLRGYY